MSYRLTIAQAVLLIGLCLLVAGTAMADGTVERQTAVKLYRGTRIIAASDPNSSVHVAGLTPEVCEVMREERWQEEAATRTTGSATYKCQVEARAIVEFHPAPTCPERSAEQTDGQLRQTCPAGTVGVWLQDRTWTLRPYPDCWVQGDWLPAEPPAGMCAPINAPPVEAWTRCATEGGRCEFTGPRLVRYGIDSTWVQAIHTDGVLCANSVFGDPLRGAPKVCELSSSMTPPAEPPVTPPPPAIGTASLTWDPRPVHTDGSPVVIAGNRIHYGRLPGELTQTVQIADVSRYTVTGLAAGTWYFAVRAYTSTGNESALSNIATKAVR